MRAVLREPLACGQVEPFGCTVADERMEQPSQVFVRRLMNEVLRLHRIPKVQVERIVGPILGLFLPQVLGALIEAMPDREGFAVVSPEFPLKRPHSNQSTNIDWLLGPFTFADSSPNPAAP